MQARRRRKEIALEQTTRDAYLLHSHRTIYLLLGSCLAGRRRAGETFLESIYYYCIGVVLTAGNYVLYLPRERLLEAFAWKKTTTSDQLLTSTIHTFKKVLTISRQLQCHVMIWLYSFYRTFTLSIAQCTWTKSAIILKKISTFIT